MTNDYLDTPRQLDLGSNLDGSEIATRPKKLAQKQRGN